MNEDRTIMPIRYMTIDDMEETGEFDSDFIQYLRAISCNRSSKSEMARNQYDAKKHQAIYP